MSGIDVRYHGVYSTSAQLLSTDSLAAAEATAWVATLTKSEPPVAAECGDEDAICEWLCSGVLLCNLLNTVVPGTIAKIPSPIKASVSTAARKARALETVGQYLTGCRSLGVPAHDLFSSVDLVEGKVSVTYEHSDRA